MDALPARSIKYLECSHADFTDSLHFGNGFGRAMTVSELICQGKAKSRAKSQIAKMTGFPNARKSALD
jgi:hypothetical protein